MNLWRPLAVLALVAPSTALLPAVPASAACSGKVLVEDFSFTPASLNVTPGTTVTWCWRSGNHSVTSDTGLFDSNPEPSCPPTCSQPDHVFTFKFTTASSTPFTYKCKIHSSMHGSIVVKQQATPSPTKTTRPPTTPPATRTPTPSRTATPTTAAPTTTKPPSTPPTTSPPPTTTAPATTVPAPTPSETPTSTAPLVLDPAPNKPRTGLAIVAGLVVAIAALGGAAAIWLRGRSPL